MSLQLISLYFAAYCFRKLGSEFNYSRIFVRSCMLLYVFLYFLFEFLCTLYSLYKNNACFYYLTSYFIRCRRYTSFKYIRKLHYNVFYFERSYAVSRRFDNVVYSAYIPEISVLISPCNVSRMIHTVMP